MMLPAMAQHPTEPSYLTPYLRAAERHGGGFGSLLWASRKTQAARFVAITRATDFANRTVLDAGCGRADFLDFLLARKLRPLHYVGIEAVGALADAAEAKDFAGKVILRHDFVREPARLFVGAERVVISGALNTLDPEAFYATARRAYDACAEVLVFNFLSSPMLAGQPFLHWHAPKDVIGFARTLTPHVRVVDDYLDGDCTVALRKPEEAPLL